MIYRKDFSVLYCSIKSLYKIDPMLLMVQDLFSQFVFITFKKNVIICSACKMSLHFWGHHALSY